MKLRSVSCEGYRTFSTSTRLKISPITVIFGKNNSGKTTLARLPMFIAASLRQPENFYSLQNDGVVFGSSFRDLGNSKQPHPQLFYEIKLDTGDAWGIDLQNIVDSSLRESVEPTRIVLDGEALGIPLGLPIEDPSLPSPAEVLRRHLPHGLYIRFEQRRAEIARGLEGIMHIPSSRRAIENIYEGRPARAWTPDEVPYLLNEVPELAWEVSAWFEQRFGGGPVHVDRTSYAFRLVAEQGGNTNNLSVAGRGTQSVLPIVTLLLGIRGSLRKPPLVVLEEPETHLHPSAHAALADLVIDARHSCPIIVETHSENFILRIRRRIAERALDPREFRLYFVEDSSIVREIPVDENGGTEDWPTGVFEYDIVEARALVQARLHAMRAERA